MNMQRPLVSIIVPVYNVEKYLERCIQSLVRQTLNDIEIILVDDGSSDSSGLLCNKFAERDRRIQVVHKENGGLSSARNAGLKVASGRYVGFVDSDDDVELDMYERMSATAEKYQVDFVMADYLRIFADGKRTLKTLDIQAGLYDRQKIRDDIFAELIMKESIDYGPLLSVWHCLYRTDFLREHSLRFDEEVRWSEDNIFSAVMGYYCGSFYYMRGEALYHYYQNEGTITTSYRKGAWQVYCTMNDHLHDFFDKIKDYNFERQLKLHMIYYACNCIEQTKFLEQEQSLQQIQEILHDSHLTEAFKHFRLPKISVKLKLQLLLMKWKWGWVIYKIRR